MEKPKIGYMCSTTFEHEVGQVSHGTKIYSTINDLKREAKCVAGKDRCGIVKVEVRELEYVTHNTFLKRRKNVKKN
jgi:hypothetical protein